MQIRTRFCTSADDYVTRLTPPLSTLGAVAELRRLGIPNPLLEHRHGAGARERSGPFRAGPWSR
jgi:hypothetical protein